MNPAANASPAPVESIESIGWIAETIVSLPRDLPTAPWLLLVMTTVSTSLDSSMSAASISFFQVRNSASR